MKLIACLIKICFFVAFVTCKITVYANNTIKKGPSKTYTAFIVNGKVVDGKGKGLSGASIMQKEQSNGTTTAADGSFSITIQSASAVLVISYIGFETKEVFV